MVEVELKRFYLFFISQKSRKTGFTKKAKRTLVTSASKDNINLIVVTLNCGGDFKTHQDIYESYFNTHKSIKILNKGENSFNNVNLLHLN